MLNTFGWWILTFWICILEGISMILNKKEWTSLIHLLSFLQQTQGSDRILWKLCNQMEIFITEHQLLNIQMAMLMFERLSFLFFPKVVSFYYISSNTRCLTCVETAQSLKFTSPLCIMQLCIQVLKCGFYLVLVDL